MRGRRIVLRDGNGEIVKAMDVSDVDHANAQFEMTLSIETMCDMGDWHHDSSVRIAPWGERIR